MNADTAADEEVKAIQVLYRAIQDHPQSYPLLHVQADFLRSKVGGSIGLVIVMILMIVSVLGQAGMGIQAGEASGQLCTFRVCDMVETYRSQYRDAQLQRRATYAEFLSDVHL